MARKDKDVLPRRAAYWRKSSASLSSITKTSILEIMILDRTGARKVEVWSISEDRLTAKKKHLQALRAKEGFATLVAGSPIGSPARLSAKLRILKIMHPDRVT